MSRANKFIGQLGAIITGSITTWFPNRIVIGCVYGCFSCIPENPMVLSVLPDNSIPSGLLVSVVAAAPVSIMKSIFSFPIVPVIIGDQGGLK